MTTSDTSTGPTSPLIETELRDGTPVRIRSIVPDDKRLLEVGMAHLSPQSRYFRFFRPLTEIPAKLLQKFTEVDHVNHEAIGALDIGGPEHVPVGVARYIRSLEHNSRAEVAVTVVDSHQGRGLGTLLLAVLARAAVSNGIDEFEAMVLSHNSKMLQVFEELGASMTRDSSGEIEVLIPLSRDGHAYPQTPVGDVFRRIFAPARSA